MLGRDDLGALEPGRRADFAVFPVAQGEATAGAWDPLAALVLCAPVRAREVFVEGRAVVREGRIAAADYAGAERRARSLARGLTNG